MALLGFSVHLIWKLRMDQTQKIVLTAIFAVGGLYVTYALVFAFSPCFTLLSCPR